MGDDIETNRKLGRQFFAEQDRLRGGPAEALCTDDYTARLGSNPPMPRAGHEGFAQAFYAAFPDMHHEVEDVIATADTAVVRFVLHGTHRAAFFGIPATEKRVSVPAHVILRIRDGRVRELLGIFDEAGMLRQLGVIPS
jgi:steroid delta-isomerase-like uncharacterized protein